MGGGGGDAVVGEEPHVGGRPGAAHVVADGDVGGGGGRGAHEHGLAVGRADDDLQDLAEVRHAEHATVDARTG